MAEGDITGQMQQLQVQQVQQGGQQGHNDHQQQTEGPGFGAFYTSVCDRVRAEGVLESVMEDFGKCTSDQGRISYIWKLPEVQQLQLKRNTSGKCKEEAQACEELYNMLVTSESNAARALEVIQRAVMKTPADDNSALAIRHMKRGWALLLLEQFEDAFVDATRSLKLCTAPGLLWNAHEILGHCHAKLKRYKEAETHFVKALEGLRKSAVSNEEKAAVAGRVSTVFRMVKEENKPKNRAKETTKKLEEGKKKRIDKKKKKPEDDTTADDADTLPVLRSLPELPKVAFGRHPKLESASAAISVVVVEGRGRCVVANRDIKPGSVLMVDKPYSFVVNSDQLYQRCGQCCRVCCTGLPCQGCAVMQYCTEECRTNGAVRHRLECSIMTHLYDATLGKMGPLVFRILDTVSWTRLKKCQEKLSREHLSADEAETKGVVESIVEGSQQQKWRWEGSYSPTDYLATFYLVANSSKRSFGDHFKRSLSAVYITQCLVAVGYFGQSHTEDDLKFVASLALRHLQNTSCNAYEISEMQCKDNLSQNQSLEVGGAVYPTISLTNHSCFPNAARYNIGNSCVLRATRVIPRGEEILDNYGFYFHVTPLIQRQDALRLQYKFECQCEACKENWPLYPHRQGEPIIFRCPVDSCNSPSSFLDGLRTECKACGNKNEYGKVVSSISSKLNNYSKALALMHEHQFEAALQTLIQHQMFLELRAVYPAKHYTDVQETIRQCLNCLGNVNSKDQSAHSSDS